MPVRERRFSLRELEMVEPTLFERQYQLPVDWVGYFKSELRKAGFDLMSPIVRTDEFERMEIVYRQENP